MVIARWVHKQTKRFIWGYSQSKLNVLHCMRKQSVFRCVRFLFIIRNAPCSKRKTDVFCSIGYWKLVITVPAVASETIRWHGVHSSHHCVVSVILRFQSQTLNTDPSFPPQHVPFLIANCHFTHPDTDAFISSFLFTHVVCCCHFMYQFYVWLFHPYWLYHLEETETKQEMSSRQETDKNDLWEKKKECKQGRM